MGLFKSKEEKQQEAAAKQLAAAAQLASQQQRDADLQVIVEEFARGEYNFGTEASIILGPSEALVLDVPGVTLIEPKAIRRGTYGGPRVRVAKGVSIGGGMSQYESHDELKTIDEGSFTLTDKRAVFSGGIRTQTIALKKVVSVEPVLGGVGINHSSKQKTQYFSFPEIRANFVVGAREYPNELVSPEMLAALVEGVAKRSHI